MNETALSITQSISSAQNNIEHIVRQCAHIAREHAIQCIKESIERRRIGDTTDAALYVARSEEALKIADAIESAIPEKITFYEMRD